MINTCSRRLIILLINEHAHVVCGAAVVDSDTLSKKRFDDIIKQIAFRVNTVKSIISCPIDPETRTCLLAQSHDNIYGQHIVDDRNVIPKM